MRYKDNNTEPGTEVKPGQEDGQVPTSTPDTNSTQDNRRVQDPDSMLNTFIQWVTKPEKGKKITKTKQQKEKPDKTTKKLNFLKKSRSDKGATSEELKLLKERLARLESNPLLQNVHFSRPSTPQAIPSTSTGEPANDSLVDRYRVMYLLVRVEQQLEHTRRVVHNMQEKGAKRLRVRSVSKVMRQIDNLRDQLLRILGNDTDTIERIGDADDMELFFQNIDSICSAAQEITFDGDGNEALCKLLLENSDTPHGVITLKDGKVKMKKTGSSPGDLRDVFGTDKKDNMPESYYYKNTKEALEKYRNKGGDSDGGRTGNGDRNKLMYKSETVESWSDTDTDEEMCALEKSNGQKYKWPMLNTIDEQRIEKEKKLHTLMTEIDELMDEVGLTDNKAHSNGITYEVLMMGSGEMTKATEKKEIPKKKVKKFETNPDKFKAARSKMPVKKSRSQSDQFVEEFDKLLNECDKKK